MNPNLGRTAIWSVGDLNFYVQIVGHRKQEGEPEEYRIIPLDGSGSMWVTTDTVRLRNPVLS